MSPRTFELGGNWARYGKCHRTVLAGMCVANISAHKRSYVKQVALSFRGKICLQEHILLMRIEAELQQ